MSSPRIAQNTTTETQNDPSHQPLLRSVMPELDSIRGLAILMVVFYHGLYGHLNLSSYSPAVKMLFGSFWVGRLGVSLFFVLSGFLISGLLLDSVGRKDYFKRFYIRRALRILPAYAITIIVVALAIKGSGPFVVLSIFYLSNLTPLFGIPIAYSVLWSLAVEEQFYLLWPLLVKNVSRKTLAAVCIAIICASPLLRALSFILYPQGTGTSFVCNEFTWNSIDGLACGALLAVWLRSAKPRRASVWQVAGILTVAAVVIEAATWPLGIYTRQRITGAALQVVPWHFLFTALLCAALLLGTSRWSRLVRWPVLRFYGDISYGLYLYHIFAFAIVESGAKAGLFNFVGNRPIAGLLCRFAIALPLATGISWISRRTIEDYFLSLKRVLAPGS